MSERPVGGAAARLAGGVRRGGPLLLDQAVVSGLNFITQALLLRWLGLGAFGVYVLGFNGLVAALLAQNSLVTGPLGVLGVDREKTDPGYFRAMLFLQQALAISLALAAVLGGLVVARLLRAEEMTQMLPLMALAGWAYLTQDFFRRVLVLHLRGWEMTLNDSVSYGGQVAALTALHMAGRLSLPTAWAALAGMWTVAVLLGAWQCRRWLRSGHGDSRRYWAEALAYGRWLLAGEMSAFVALQGPRYVLGAMQGKEAVGVLGAVENLFRPTQVLLLAADTTGPTLVALARRHSGVETARRRLAIGGAALMLVVAGYCAMATPLAEPLLRLLADRPVPVTMTMLLLFSAYYVLYALSRVTQVGLRALERPEWLFIARSLGALVTVAAANPLIRAFSVSGAVAAMLVALAVTTAVQHWALRRVIAASASQPQQ